MVTLGFEGGAARVRPFRTSCRVQASDVYAVMELEPKDISKWTSEDVSKIERALTEAIGKLAVSLPSDPVRALGELMIRLGSQAGDDAGWDSYGAPSHALPLFIAVPHHSKHWQ